MKQSKKKSVEVLREKAEELLKKKTKVTNSILSESETLKVLHELEVHQIELELQNEELLLANKQAEQISEKYVELYDFAPTGYFTLSRDAEIIELNLTGANKLGRERLKLRNSNFVVFISVDTRETFSSFLDRSFSSGKKEQCEVRLITGRESPLYVHIIGIADETREKCYITVIDISEKKKADDKLIAEQAFRSSIESSLSSGIAIVDNKGCQTYVNSSFCELLGWSKDELTGVTAPFVYWPPEQIQTINEAFQLTIANKAPKEGFELVFKSKAGDLIPVQVIISPFSDGKHRTGWLANVIDITERKKMEEALIESEEKYRTLFNTESDALFLIDSVNYSILDVNESACQMYGYTREEMLKLRNFDLSAELEETKRMTLELKERIELRYHKKKDGTVFPVDISSSEINYKNRKEILAAIRDINERVKFENELVLKNEQLERINAEKDKFFSIIAHDLRSPFTGFLGFTDLLKSGLADLSLKDLQGIVNSMSISANNLFALLTNLLEWSMMKRGLTAFTPKLLSLKNTVDCVAEVFYDNAKNKSITLLVDIPEDIKISADGAMLETILRNLISNALKFSNSGGTVIVTAVSNNNAINISVKDSGLGISSDSLEELFEIDKRNSRKGTAGEPSTGLGLLLCKELVEKHNGNISIHSEVGKGSEFIVSFPAVTI